MSFIKKIKQAPLLPMFIVVFISIILIVIYVNREKSKTFVLQNKVVNMETTYFYKGDTVIRQKSKVVLLCDKLDLTSEQITKQAEAIGREYNNIIGVEHEQEIDVFNKKIILLTEIDYTKAKIRQIAHLPGALFESDDKKISMQKIEDMLQERKWHEKSN